MSRDSHHGMIHRLFEGWIFLYLLHDLVVIAKSFPAVSNQFNIISRYIKTVYDTWWLNLPVSGHSSMLITSVFLRASMDEEEEKKRRRRGVGEMEEIDLVNKRSHCELNGHSLIN